MAPAVLTTTATTNSLAERFARLRLDVVTGGAVAEGRRHASVKAQGAYRLKNKKTIPKKLGAKKTGGALSYGRVGLQIGSCEPPGRTKRRERVKC